MKNLLLIYVFLFSISTISFSQKKNKSDKEIITTIKIDPQVIRNNIPIMLNTGRVMTDFDPKVHGFHFENRFDNQGYYAGVNINLPGLCGGMVYSALDYYFSGTPVPELTETPNEGTDLTEYIRQRHMNTLVAQSYKWTELGFNPFGWRTMEYWNWGVQGFDGGRLAELMQYIDKGKPVVLGLFKAGSGGFTGKHHQVVAIGYDLNGYDGKLGDKKENLEIFIYDPNVPDEMRTLIPDYDESNPRYYYKEEPDKKWLTYFVDKRYTKKTPLDPDVISACNNKNIENENLEGANLAGKNYRCTKGKRVILRGATLNGADFYHSNLTRGNFYGSRSNAVNFEKSNLSDANFVGADLKNSTFNDALLANANFYGADLKDVKMLDANAIEANFTGADLHRGVFSGTFFINAVFYGASLNTITCENCDFRGANLDRADLRGSDFTGSNFEGAIITENTLIDSNTLGLPE